MSCQPDEFSLEGPQWGGGRGVFSYYFLNGITGFADLNKDGNISLFEIDRFLGDKIPEATSPSIQIPMAIGNKGTIISSIDQPSLMALQKNEFFYSDQLLAIDDKSDKKVEAFAQTNVDPILIEKYSKFKQALKEGHLVCPEENSAWSLYQQLKDKPFIASELASIQSNFAAALQDEAQQAINDYLKADPQELKKRWSYDDKYERFPIYLNKSTELLGKTHYLYKTIKAREHYFIGLNLRLRGERQKDTSLYRLALYEQTKTLELDSSASYSYNELGILERRFRNYIASVDYFNKAILHSPKWVFPWANLISSYFDLKDYEMAIQTGLKAISIDPNSALANYNLANAYQRNSNWGKATEYYLKTLQIDSTELDAMISLVFTLYKEKKYDQAEQMINDYSKLRPEDSSEYIPGLLCLYFIQGQEDKTIETLEAALKSGYNDFKSIEAEQDLKNFITSPRYIELKNKYFN